ncbi:MAG TPA: MarR family winged helix-turn-helix transcriptional regulator [Acidimicrobiales bacterium]|nr:MarR family winged helix-turn-helix transcriptional regulator [Acidimicrobiales bacterium]
MVKDEDSEAAARLRIAVARLSRRLKPTAAAGSLTTTEVDVLATVTRCGPIKLSDLAVIAGLNPTMLSRVVAKLEELALLRRLGDDSDRRVARAEVTSAGRELHARIRSERTDLLSRQLELLGERDRRAVAAAIPALEALAERLLDTTSGERT